MGVVVVGESANRLHWSLYGYPPDTTPRMREMSANLFTFTDVVSGSVGTVGSITGMMTTPTEAIPVFHLFTGAGYTTHWISTRSDNGEETQLAALVQSCDDRIYLSGGYEYDERLVPFLARAVAMPGKQLIFLNLTGSHVRYSVGTAGRIHHKSDRF